METENRASIDIETAEHAVGADDLVARCRRGDDPTAWRDVVRRFAPYVYAVTAHAYRLPDHDAEDVFHEVFVQTWSRLEELGDDDALRRLIVELARSLSRERLQAVAADSKPPARDLLETLDDALGVSDALGELSAVDQEIIRRFFVDEQAPAVIAQALGVPEGAVVRGIRRARRRLDRRVTANRRKGTAPLTPP